MQDIKTKFHCILKLNYIKTAGLHWVSEFLLAETEFLSPVLTDKKKKRIADKNNFNYFY